MRWRRTWGCGVACGDYIFVGKIWWVRNVTYFVNSWRGSFQLFGKKPLGPTISIVPTVTYAISFFFHPLEKVLLGVD